ncbi:MAG: VWA domain-containing protein [Elusimicrobia bacterium]|nr:VWA domain-containing protein [Elusimicrobiota bacterium]
MNLFRTPSVFLVFAAATAGIALLWYIGAARKRRLTRMLFKNNVLEEINLNFSSAGAKAKNILFLTGVALFFIALAGPQWGVEERQVEAEASYIIIAVDVSSSMKARDLKPDRMENAKNMLKILAGGFTDERVGIVAFTSQAYTQSPVTSDTEALKYFINNLRADMLAAKGTSLYAAVQRSAEMLTRYPGKKALILLTDGEDHTPEELDNAVKTARAANIAVIAVGIGTTEGELIPEAVDNTGKVISYKQDKSGKPVVTKLDEASLKTLASGTGGVYIKYTNYEAVSSQIAQSLQSLDKEKRDLKARSGYKNRYQMPLALGIILVFLSLVIPLKKVKL